MKITIQACDFVVSDTNMACGQRATTTCVFCGKDTCDVHTSVTLSMHLQVNVGKETPRRTILCACRAAECSRKANAGTLFYEAEKHIRETVQVTADNIVVAAKLR